MLNALHSSRIKGSPEEAPLPTQRPQILLATGALIFLIQACAPAPVQEPVEAPTTEEVPEITLNLPEENNCECVTEEVADYTFLEKGYSALAAGDYVDAVQYFKSYQRLETSPEAIWEAGIAIAYVSSLPNSPFYSAEEARKSYLELSKQDWKSMNLHQQSLLMRQSLESSVIVERHVAELESSNATLREDLEKREDALKRLRELTLGQ